ncbi:hypothetical protein [Agromyces humatus]|uniref:Uncharacterized protein n=1 Tax=Agromyces humatus TaxID=279573 RepID=A0ABP4WF80_9MICO|nr:hypothetical protein [Agromyces humatus]
MLRTVVLVVLFAALAAGALVSMLSLPGFAWAQVSPSPGGAGLTLLVASLAGLAALAAEQAWSRQRKAERETDLRRKRSDQYIDVIAGVISVFRDDSAASTSSEIARTREERQAKLITERATIALWGSSAFIGKYGEWVRFVSSVSGSTGTAILDDSQKRNVQRLIGELVVAARDDLDMLDAVEQQSISAMVFNDYHENGSSPQDAGRRAGVAGPHAR